MCVLCLLIIFFLNKVFWIDKLFERFWLVFFECLEIFCVNINLKLIGYSCNIIIIGFNIVWCINYYWLIILDIMGIFIIEMVMVKLFVKEEIYNRFREKVKLVIIDDFFFSRLDLIIELILLFMSKRFVVNFV